MTGAPLLLGLDLGTSRIKALLVDHGGAEVGRAAAPTPFETTGERVEMTVAALRVAVGEALAGLGGARGRVVAAGLAGMAESGAPLDARGRPLAPVIAWHDPRGAEAVALLADRFGDDLSRAIGQRLRTVSSVAKLAWLVAHGVGGVRRWLGVPELCLEALTGAQATEHSLAARTGAYHVAERRWLPEVPAAAGLPDGVFAPVEPAGADLGRVTAAGSAWSGLPAGAAVALAGHDHLAGAVGAAGPADLANSVGTAETVVGRHPVVPDIGRALELGAAVTVWPGGEGWAVLASAARAGLVLDAAARALGRPPAELDALAGGAGRVEVPGLVEALQQGEPVTLPAAAAEVVWNGLLHALASRTWEAAGRVRALVGPARRLVVFGGGSASRPWVQAKADAGWLPVVRCRVPDAVARGAAVLAGVAAGWWATPEEAPPPPLEAVQPTSSTR